MHRSAQQNGVIRRLTAEMARTSPWLVAIKASENTGATVASVACCNSWPAREREFHMPQNRAEKTHVGAGKPTLPEMAINWLQPLLLRAKATRMARWAPSITASFRHGSLLAQRRNSRKPARKIDSMQKTAGTRQPTSRYSCPGPFLTRTALSNASRDCWSFTNT